MVRMTMQISDESEQGYQSIGAWLQAVTDLNFIGFKTPATIARTELIEFLSKTPSPEELLGFHVSESAQMRLSRLSALDKAGYLSEAEQAELDDLQRLEHIVIMLRTRAGSNQIDYCRVHSFMQVGRTG